MVSAPRRPPRVQDEAAFVLHQHDWSESSLILEVFSRHHGRVALVAKGVKRPTSQFRAVLLPLQPLRLGWGGDAEVRTLKAAQWQGGQLMPTGEALLAGYYLNELLLKLLARDDPHAGLFDHYAQTVRALAEGAPQAPALRAFELLLLRDVGLLPSLDVEGGTLSELVPSTAYRLLPEHGLLPSLQGFTEGCSGKQWSDLQRALDGPDPCASLMAVASEDRTGALRRQLRDLLHYHSGVRVFQTRQFMADLQRLTG